MAAYGSEAAYLAASLKLMAALVAGDDPWSGGKPSADEVLQVHTIPEVPEREHVHYEPGTSYAVVSPGASSISAEVAPVNVDFVPRSEPYSLVGFDIVESVTPMSSPADITRANFPGSIERGAQSTLRARGSAAANAAGVMGADVLMSERASVLAIFGRAVSALGMLKEGWWSNGGARGRIDIRVTDVARFEASRRQFPYHVALYIPDGMTETQAAAMVSLMVDGGPSAYRWVAGDGQGGEVDPHIMPAGARYAWPGGFDRFLLVTEAPRPWNVAFGGGALTLGPVGGLVTLMRERFGQAQYVEAAKTVAAVNRCYCAPEYVGLNVNSGRLTRADVVREQCGNGVDGERARFPRPDARGLGSDDPAPFDGGPMPMNPFPRPALADADLVNPVATILAQFVDDGGRGADGAAPAVPTLVRAEALPEGLQVRSTRGVRVYAWDWEVPEHVGDDVFDDFERAWWRLVSIYNDERYALRDPMERRTRQGRTCMVRSVWGQLDGTVEVIGPRLNMDGWYAVLISLSALTDLRRADPAFFVDSLPLWLRRYAADLHLLTARQLFEGGLAVVDLKSPVRGAVVLSSFPSAYHTGVFPREFSWDAMPYGSLECLESGVLLGGDNTAAYVGFAVPGAWRFTKQTRIAEVDTGGQDAGRVGRRAFEAASRAVAWLGGQVTTSVPSQVGIAIMRQTVGAAHLIHPFFLPSRVLYDGDVVSVGLRGNTAEAAMLFSSGATTHAFRASGVGY